MTISAAAPGKVAFAAPVNVDLFTSFALLGAGLVAAAWRRTRVS